MEPRDRDRYPSPAAQRRHGESRKARVGFVLIALVVIVTGVLLYYRLAGPGA